MEKLQRYDMYGVTFTVLIEMAYNKVWTSGIWLHGLVLSHDTIIHLRLLGFRTSELFETPSDNVIGSRSELGVNPNCELIFFQVAAK